MALGAVFSIPAEVAQAFTFTKIVDVTTPIPGATGQAFTFNNTDVPAISPTGLVAFATGDANIWRALADGTQLKRLVDTSMPIPGWTGDFVESNGYAVQVFSGDIVFVGYDGSTTRGVGLYAVPATGGAVATLVDANNPALSWGRSSYNFTADFSVPPRGQVSTSSVVFQYQQRVFAAPLSGSGSLTAIAGPQDSAASPPAPYCCIFDSPSAIPQYTALRGGNVYGRGSIQTATQSGSSFHVIANGSVHPPATPIGYVFDDFTLSQPAWDQEIVFHGASLPRNTEFDKIDGIYARGGGKPFVRLVDTSMPIPGGSGNFVLNGFGPIAARNGIVVFQAQDAVGNIGLYTVPETGGTVTKIIAAGDPIGAGFHVAVPQIGKEPFNGSTLVFEAIYTNSAGSGVYATQIAP